MVENNLDISLSLKNNIKQKQINSRHTFSVRTDFLFEFKLLDAKNGNIFDIINVISWKDLNNESNVIKKVSMSDSIMEIFYYAMYNYAIDVRFECNGYYGRKCAQIINNDERNENFWKRDLTKTQNQNYLSNIEDEEKACHDFPCENGGKCLKFQTKHYCKCSRGYIGKKCEISTCKNECINGVCSYHNSCICREGFKGSMCEISDCSENESN
ncbi:hypothetical protein HZS_1198, partial [Henneguya salminicola]